ncbi:transposase [Imtechella halotolerans]|uniref:transposase n=1 Tax=Imtechella halotolerans TaxID=1165090 RepID=UPI0021CDD402|nr:transposase [Imtechella halotolerans]
MTQENSIRSSYPSLQRYLINMSTKAPSESFKSKIKAFRSQFRGVRNIEFFLYRLTKIFA